MTVIQLKIRARDYVAEQAAATLPRIPVGSHPLANCSISQQVKDDYHEEVDFDDPLRATTRNVEEFSDKNAEQIEQTTTRGIDHELTKVSSKEWAAFKRSLTQRFPVTQTISTTLVSWLSSGGCVVILKFLLNSTISNHGGVARFFSDFRETPSICAL